MMNYQIFGICNLMHRLSVTEAVMLRRPAIVDIRRSQPGIARELIPGTGMYVDELITE